MNYCVRITGPGVDHQVMVNSVEDFRALELIIAKMFRQFEPGKKCICDVHPWCPLHGSQPRDAESDLLIAHLIDSAPETEGDASV